MKEKNITFHNIFYLFLFGCIFGWIVEGIWTLLKKGILINHSALIIGPFNIVYGVGAIILTLFLYKLKDKGNIVIFGMSFTIGTLLEYIMSFLMEKLVGFVAWNYSKKPFNINGRVCLMYSVFWGILGIIWIKIIYPIMEKIINSFNIIEGKRINNSYMESKNRLIAKLIYNANGFKNFKRTRNRILFCLNPNDTFNF